MAKQKSDKNWVLQAQLISILRRLFVKSPIFSATKKSAQREKKVLNKDGSISKAHRVEYKCTCCGEYFDDKKIEVEVTDKKGKKKVKKYHSIAVDHIEPFVPVEGLPRRQNGLPDWNILIDRMFVDIDFWSAKDTYEKIKNKVQLLCYKCHEEKSNKENEERRKYKKGIK